MTTPAPRPRVLCLDDEPQVVEGMSALLRRKFDVVPFTSPADALRKLEEDRGFAVVVSDLRMPFMSGVEFLARAKDLVPDAARILLTGQADVQTSVAAVNTGQVFRFLQKPADPADLTRAIGAGVEHHRLVTAERELLAQTLRGTVQVLMDVLALAHPVAFGHATRLRSVVGEIARLTGSTDTWAVEVAAMFSQLALLTVPPDAVDKLFSGQPLTPEEAAAAARGPAFVDGLFSTVPRLDAVRDILRASARTPVTVADPDLRRHAKIVYAVREWQMMEARGVPFATAVDRLKGAGIDATVLEPLTSLFGAAGQRFDERELPIRKLLSGMVLAEDMKTGAGLLLARKGYQITDSFLARALTYDRMAASPVVKVYVPRDGSVR